MIVGFIGTFTNSLYLDQFDRDYGECFNLTVGFGRKSKCRMCYECHLLVPCYNMYAGNINIQIVSLYTTPKLFRIFEQLANSYGSYFTKHTCVLYVCMYYTMINASLLKMNCDESILQ